MDTAAFAAAYLRSRGLTPAPRLAQEDEALSLAYPLCLYHMQDCELIALAPDLSEALSPIREEQRSRDAFSYPELFRFVFEEGPKYQMEIVLGLYAPKPLLKEEDAHIRPLTIEDAAALRGLRRAMGRAAWDLAEVCLTDDATMGYFRAGSLVAAAGALRFGSMSDISVCVRPLHRGKGLGQRVVRALAAAEQERGFTPLYRVEETNRASLALATKLGFVQGFRMTGATVTYP